MLEGNRTVLCDRRGASLVSFRAVRLGLALSAASRARARPSASSHVHDLDTLGTDNQQQTTVPSYRVSNGMTSTST